MSICGPASSVSWGRRHRREGRTPNLQALEVAGVEPAHTWPVLPARCHHRDCLGQRPAARAVLGRVASVRQRASSIWA